MRQCRCAKCGSDDAYIHRSGLVFTGGYGSAHFDTVSLAILLPRNELLTTEALCDDCVLKLEANGIAHRYAAIISEKPTAAMPAEAYALVFEHHALQARSLLERHGADVAPRHAGASDEAVEALRGELEYDPSNTTCFRVGQVNFGSETVRVASAHVLAAISLGAAIDDADIAMAATRYGQGVSSTNAFLDDLITQLDDQLEQY